MNASIRYALGAAAMAFASLAAAQITFYENEGFTGRYFSAQGDVGNFGAYGFNDLSSSVVVERDQWEVCDRPGFAGRCVILRPGRYPSLASIGLDNRVSSVRDVSRHPRAADNRYAPAPVASRIIVYEDEGFGGRTITTETPIDSFRQPGFNDRSASVEVIGAPWEVCESARYGGRCMNLLPGRYPTLASMGLTERISSVRASSANARIEDNRYAPAPVAGRDYHDGRDYRRRQDERLYEANVTSVRAVVGAAEQRCWVEREQVPQQRGGVNVPGAVAGALIGGILGHQIGNGRGQDFATVGGAVAGGAIGANVGGGQYVQQDVQRCATAPSQAPTYWDVTYSFRGQEHRVQMTTPPGPTVTVNEQGEPRA